MPTGENPLLVPRVPEATSDSGKKRLDRFSKIVSSIINSWLGQGIFLQKGPDFWALGGKGLPQEDQMDGKTIWVDPADGYRLKLSTSAAPTLGGYFNPGYFSPQYFNPQYFEE